MDLILQRDFWRKFKLRRNLSITIGWFWSRDFSKRMRGLEFCPSVTLRPRFHSKIGSRSFATTAWTFTSVRILVKVEKAGHEELGLRIVNSMSGKTRTIRNRLVVSRNRKLLEVSSSEEPLVLLRIEVFLRRRCRRRRRRRRQHRRCHN